MSNYYSSQLQVHNWMLAQMSNYPPPPPQPDQQHYNALYPTQGGAQQQLLEDPAAQQQLQFSSLNQPIYPKVEGANAVSSPSSQHIQSLAQELTHHAALEDQRHHHMHAHQMQQPTPVTSHPNTASNPHTQTSTPEQPPQKTNRLRKACDSCSIRKVKCDETGPPCRACAALDIPCTFDRPSRRRGPPNRHAEAIKRRRLEEQQSAANSPGLSGTSSPTSPTHAAQALTALAAHSSTPLSAESICPLETLDLLIDDFFTYIHPLCPFPHEPSFREAWKRREDLTNKSFLALLASMIGALVASFPRKPRLHLKAQKRESLFSNHMSLVQRCQKVCAAARGAGYLESEHLNVYDAATSYFVALMGIYTFRWRLGRLYFGECLTILRTLGLHKPKGQPYNQLGTLPTAMGMGSHQQAAEQNGTEHHVDNITQEMGRRIFWTMFVSVKSMEQLGASFGELVIPPPTRSEPYPPLPAEVDDFCIYPTHTEPQPTGLVPIISGFNANARVYCSYNALATMEMAWGIDAIVDWDRQKRVLHESLRCCKAAMVDLPPELTVNTEAGLSEHQNGNGGFYPAFAQPHLGRDPAASLMSPTSRPSLDQTPEERRRSQYEIQKANIYASSLATRSYLVEKYWNLCEAHQRSRSQNPSSLPSSPGAGITAAGIDGMVPQIPTSHYDMIENEMRDERESIVKDLLVVLGSIDQVNMEPNGDSFTMKIRSIASTLLEVPEQRKGQLAMQAQEYLGAFLKILMRLERVSPANSDADQPEDEDSELRQWADLRDYQMKFAQQGGLLGLS
ncbi:Zn(II)2Cys6 transcription factor like [Lecanosticta acicola]|uniref:Zn(II)2Cys6 transcription factor like n=1 Tax=Lecanosticta acicola TaxID=111012 RepID=A0AAI8Z807_9PEZI|nr:Zn(II)2Cys6 transcription factor like [Lecanosticta acicola]